MCGIVGLVQRFDEGARFDDGPLAAACAALEAWSVAAPDAAARLIEAARSLEAPSRALVGWAGFRALRERPALQEQVRRAAKLLSSAAEAVDARLADASALASSSEGEALSRGAVAARDVAWRLVEDALKNVESTAALRAATEEPGLKGWFELWRLNLVLNQLGRLEVRGRDSGGVASLVLLDGPTWAAARGRASLASELARRAAIPHLRDGAVLQAPLPDGGVALGFAHKVAREVGELGANVRDLRAKLAADGLWQALASNPGARVQVLAHTRWASNGIISEPNCHPVGNDLPDRPLTRIVLAALNGDVDNYVTLAAGWPIPAECTTDAKVIPLEVMRHLEAGRDAGQAFLQAVSGFTGSTAIGALSSDDPERVHLSQRGSGQAIYVGVTDEGGFLFASELYGVVEAAPRFYKLEGEPGEVVRVRGLAAGEDPLRGLERVGHDGAPRALEAGKLKAAPIATRDIDRAGYSHFLLKEISQAPSSIERTLRGKFVLDASRPRFLLGDDVVPAAVRRALAERKLRRVYVIGQGTAAVAGQAMAEAMTVVLRPAAIDVRALPATELSGFYLQDLGPDVLIVAVSQSGTTTDTNRTVDLARERGAHVIAIVNRRGSDLADKAHGVLYTSDGRDVEMSVASTKAFYCQVVAGYLLGLQLAELARALEGKELAARLHRLADLPRCLRVVLDEARDRIRLAAQHALTRRHWTVVGSGPMLHAAREIRIKLSELCYKAVAVDTIEDKKHIDLSSEPMILVCAAGLSGPAATDAVKEVAIYKAHNAVPVVICDRGETRFADYAEATIEVPAASPEVALLLNTMAGHLFSYEVARAIDRLTQPLRQVRELAEAAHESLRVAADHASAVEAQETLGRARKALKPLAAEVFAQIDQGLWNTAVAPETTLRLTTALRVALGHVPWQEVRPEQAFPQPHEMLEHLLAEVTRGIDALRRPIDAIKHQAKTVTVGISREVTVRAEPGPLLRALEEVGVKAKQVSDQDAAALAALEPVIERVAGAVAYRLDGLDPLGGPTDQSRIQVQKKTGCAADMTSRADRGAALAGTKRAIVRAPRVWVGLGQRDGQQIVACPAYRKGVVSGLGLLHVSFKAEATTRERVRALRATGRYEDLRCAVTEHDVPWSDALLDSIPVSQLLTAPVEALARDVRAKVEKNDGDAGALLRVGTGKVQAS